MVLVAVSCSVVPKPLDTLVAQPGLKGVNRRQQKNSAKQIKMYEWTAASPQMAKGPGPVEPYAREQDVSEEHTAVSSSGVGAGGGAAQAANAQPAHERDATTQPAEAVTRSGTPYRVTPDRIIQLMYKKSPSVRASREAMIAARYGLEEFKTNLSRIEPFIENSGTASAFPERRDSRGLQGETVGGLQTETFEGAVLKVEGGASASRVEFGDVEQGEDEIERGSGGLVRARVEMPFVGSRKRQNRVINQAFQESQARGAELEYLSDFRSYALNALRYYYFILYQLEVSRVREEQMHQLQLLLDDPRILDEDRPQIQSSLDNVRVARDRQIALYRKGVFSLISTLGLSAEDEYVIETPPYQKSTYVDRARTPQGREQLLKEAYENNPTFQVLENAIEDFELQHEQAIVGRFDMTVFGEATQFAFGAETFDDRVGGWQVGGGVNVRLNDYRVLKATRLKAEAQIRRYQAEIEAEQLDIQRIVAINADQVVSDHEQRLQNLRVIKQKKAEFRRRRKAYLEDDDSPWTIDDVLTPLRQGMTAGQTLALNEYNIGLAEAELRSATGDVYRVAGMKLNED